MLYYIISYDCIHCIVYLMVHEFNESLLSREGTTKPESRRSEIRGSPNSGATASVLLLRKVRMHINPTYFVVLAPPSELLLAEASFVRSGACPVGSGHRHLHPWSQTFADDSLQRSASAP